MINLIASAYLAEEVATLRLRAHWILEVKLYDTEDFALKFEAAIRRPGQLLWNSLRGYSCASFLKTVADITHSSAGGV